MSSRHNDRGGLSAGARSLLEAARDADAPKPEDRERVRRALAVAIAASAGTAGVTASAAGGAKAIAGATASTASAATSVASVASASVLTKVAIAIVALGVGSSAIVAVNHYSVAREAVTSDVATHAAVAPSAHVVDRALGEPLLEIPSELDAPIEAAPAVVMPEEAPAAVSAMTPATTHHARAAHVQADEESVEAETAVLRDAMTGTPEHRLAAVDAHEARFPNGQMAPSREQARRNAVNDLCAEGPEAVARYLAAHPRSSSAPRLRQTCGSSH